MQRMSCQTTVVFFTKWFTINYQAITKCNDEFLMNLLSLLLEILNTISVLSSTDTEVSEIMGTKIKM